MSLSSDQMIEQHNSDMALLEVWLRPSHRPKQEEVEYDYWWYSKFLEKNDPNVAIENRKEVEEFYPWS